MECVNFGNDGPGLGNDNVGQWHISTGSHGYGDGSLLLISETEQG